MFCSKCGTKLDESVRFCPNCGTTISAETSSEVKNTAEPKPTGFQTLTDYTLAEVKQFAKMRLVIAAAIVFSLGIIFSFKASPLSWLTPVLSALTDSSEISYLVSTLSQYLGAAGAASGIVSNLPKILLAVGMWLVIASAYNNPNNRVSTGGLTLIKIVTIIQFIVSLIIPVLLPIFILLTMGELFKDGTLLLITAVFAAIIIVFISYYTNLLRTITNIRYTADTGTPVVEISGFIIFCCIAGGIVSALLSILNIAGMFNAVAMILFGIVLNKYKKKMIDIRDNGRQHIVETDSENN